MPPPSELLLVYRCLCGQGHSTRDDFFTDDEASCPDFESREVTAADVLTRAAELADYEAAGNMLAELRRIKVVMVDADHSARRIVAAAHGLDDGADLAALGVDDE